MMYFYIINQKGMYLQNFIQNTTNQEINQGSRAPLYKEVVLTKPLRTTIFVRLVFINPLKQTTDFAKQ